MDIEKVKQALKWALATGATAYEDDKTFMDSGCGCCSGEVKPPEDLKPIVYEVLGWT